MLDAESIFIYKAIKKCNPKVQIMTELGWILNVLFKKKKINYSIFLI